MTTDKRLKLWGLLFALLLGSGTCFAQKKGNLKSYETEDEDRLQMLYGQVKSIKEVRRYFRFDSQTDTDVYTYNYDKQGKILEYKLLMSDSDVWNIGQYEYNTDGLKVNSWIIISDGSTDTISRNKYDERGLLLERRIWGEDGETLYRYFYNGKGQLERRVSYDDEVLRHITHYVYNDAGQLEKTFDGEDEQVVTHYKYNEQGQLTERYFVVGEFRHKYEYNSNGFINRITDKIGTMIKYTTRIYTYDKQGNWISCETYIKEPWTDKKLSARFIRTITYY